MRLFTPVWPARSVRLRTGGTAPGEGEAVQARVLVADCGGGAMAEVILGLEAEGYRIERSSASRLGPDTVAELQEIEEAPDAVLLEAAPWVSYQPLAVAAYGFPVMVLPGSDEASRLKVTPDDLLRNLKARPHAKMFLLNNPVNPTSQLYSAEEVDALLRVCVQHEIFFVLDRLYWKLVFDGASYPDPVVDEETKP